MEISREKTGDLLVLRLAGRLDANWCSHVQDALAAAVKDGEHRVQLDMAGVSYLSSAGLRVLLSFYKQLRAISGVFGVANPSGVVRSVLELSGLSLLITSGLAANTAGDETGERRTTDSASWNIFVHPTAPQPMRVAMSGDASVLASGVVHAARPVSFGDAIVALGIGALGSGGADQLMRAGEFLAVAGTAAFQPSDGSSRPDFMISEGSLVPQGQLLLGLVGEGEFGRLARFAATPEARTVGLTELAQTALDIGGSDAAVVVGVVETAGLVGATLRRSPSGVTAVPPTLERGGAALGPRFAFPEIREWLSFTSERAFRDTTSLLVGVVARPSSPFDPLLRPLGRGSSLVGHVHAAVFPYRPLRKGRIDLKASVTELFEGQPAQAILHLLCDSRGFSGAGESEFLRGALWIAPAVPAERQTS